VAPVQATVPGYLLQSWFVVVAPVGTPKPIVDGISAAIDAHLKRPGVAERLRTLGAIPIGGAPEVLTLHLAAEQARYRDVIARANIKPE
jgi:tripartite-type tricarboxylate transporter receptor subunit TctC